MGLSWNWYFMTEILFVFRFHQSQYFILRHFSVREIVDPKKTELIYTVAFGELYNKSCGNLLSQLQTFIENKVMITIRKSRFHYYIL